MPSLTDIHHYHGHDLQTTPSGDLLPATGDERTRQRIIRRLMTNPGDYIFHPEYGAGMGQKIGTLLDIPSLTSLVVGQVLLEDSVARSPAPLVTLRKITDGVAATITYVNADTGQPDGLAFNLTQ